MPSGLDQMIEVADYVVVGSGPAASVFAKRLGDSGRYSVAVLEAGGAANSIHIGIPAGFVKTLSGDRFVQHYENRAFEQGPARTFMLPQGRVVGGSSSINGLVYTRGQREDFDDWERLGNSGWGYESLLPYFKKTETYLGNGDPRYRGGSGELPITDLDLRFELCEAFIRGAKELGVPRNPDYNGAVQLGSGYFQRYIRNGKRVSCYDAFLKPAVRSGRVALITNALVERVLLDGRRATGVSYLHSGERKTLAARREVILCAGTVNTPKILQLSGIGPAEKLAKLGIETIVDLPGVGENLRDHYTVRLAARVKNASSINQMASGWRLAREIVRWGVGRPSILSLSPSLVHVFWNVAPGGTRGDIQVLFTPASYSPGKPYVLDDRPGMSIGARQQRPESAGWVELRSSDPRDLPILHSNYLGHELDRWTVVEALKFGRRLLNTSAMSRFNEGEYDLSRDVRSDAELLDYARRVGSSGYHLVGTCRMGPDGDKFAVVDSDLRVRDVARLRVVDASVMPRVPSGNTLAAAAVVGEAAAAKVLQRQDWPTRTTERRGERELRV